MSERDCRASTYNHRWCYVHSKWLERCDGSELPVAPACNHFSRLLAAERLAEALARTIANLEHLEPDVWMSGHVHGSDVMLAETAPSAWKEARN